MNYFEEKEKIVSLLKSPDIKNRKIGIGLVDSLLKLKGIELVAFALSNDLFPKIELFELTNIFMLKAMGYYKFSYQSNVYADAARKAVFDITMTNPCSMCEIKLKVESFNQEPIIILQTSKNILEYYLLAVPE